MGYKYGAFRGSVCVGDSVVIPTGISVGYGDFSDGYGDQNPIPMTALVLLLISPTLWLILGPKSRTPSYF